MAGGGTLRSFAVDRRMLIVFLLLAAAALVFLALASEISGGDTLTLDRRLLLALRDPGDPAMPVGPVWLRQAMVDVTALGGVTLGTAAVDGNGNFATEITIPSGLAAGDHTLVVTGNDSSGAPRTVERTITVGSGVNELPRTGAEHPVPWVFAGAALLLAGLGLGAGHRHRLRRG